MEPFIPTWFDLAGWGGVLFASVALLGFGRLLTLGRAAPEMALVAGWGGAALALTAWGIVTPAAMRWPATAVALLGLLALLLPRIRLDAGAWRGIGRIVILAVPLLAVMASARPSLPDTFLNLLPNAAYLDDHQFFPADDRPPAHSFIAAAPYNLQLAAFLAGLVTPGFPTNAMIGLNLVLWLAAGLFLARLAAGLEDAPDAAPSWGAAALGLLLATALDPGFVPRYHLSAYSETGVTVALALAGWAAARALAQAEAGRSMAADLCCFALVLAALVNIKQEAVAMAAGVLAASGTLALLQRDRGAILLRLAAAALPAAVLYLGWRWYVLAHFASGELKPLPFAEWQWGALPAIFRSMLHEATDRGVYFGALVAVFAALARRWRRRDLATRMAAILAIVFLAYNAALVWAYVGHFPGEMGASAHSYFRYNTHLALLLMAAIVLFLRAPLRARLAGPRRRWAAAVAVAAMLVAPLGFVRFLRFDLEVPQLRAWDLATWVAERIAADARLGLLLPGDNSSVATMLEGVLRDVPPRRKDVDLLPLDKADAAALATLDARGYRLALLACAPGDLAGVAAGEAALLERTPSGWRAVAVRSYPPPPAGARWSQVLSPSALCL
jgi:hypothetical protein